MEVKSKEPGLPINIAKEKKSFWVEVRGSKKHQIAL